MEAFQAQRIVREYRDRIEAPAAEVFPLLCPVREHEWLPGWSSRMIYSDSGLIEKDCIFVGSFLGNGSDVWICTAFDPDAFVKEFVIVGSGRRVVNMRVQLKAQADGSTDIAWRTVITPLNEAGNTEVRGLTDEAYQHMMGNLVKCLKYYCATGTMVQHGRHG